MNQIKALLSLFTIILGMTISVSTLQAMNTNEHTKTIYLAGGCFWGCEKYFSEMPGIIGTEVGYANGKTPTPSYEDVCTGTTGHAETVKITYNPKIISLPFLLEQYYKVINPTSLNQQGNDRGSQYRTGIYYTDKTDQPIIEASLKKLQASYTDPIAVECLPLTQFSSAEAYHQSYLNKNPNGYCHIPSSQFDKAKNAHDPSLKKDKDQ